MRYSALRTLRVSTTALLLAVAVTAPAATSTFIGTGINWNAATNWLSSAVPSAGDDLVITDTSSVTNLTMNDSAHMIGLLQFGATGTRANPGSAQFIINGNVTTTAAYVLTVTNGLVANGNFQVSGVAGFQTKLPITVQGDQTWSVGGNPGSSTADYGVMLTVGATGTQRPLVLNGKLTKTGAGQLCFVGQNVGNGDIVVNQGSLKFNAGSSTTLTVGGTGAITVNNGGGLFISRNSGTLNITKAIVLNNGATLRLGGNNAGLNFVGSPIAFNGTVPILLDYSGLQLAFTNNWSGTLNSTITGSGGTNTFWGDNSTLAGTLNNNGTYHLRFASPNSSSAGVAWGLNNAAAFFDIFGTNTSLQFGALGGTAGTVVNNNTNNLPATLTVGALNTSTTFGGVLADGTAALGLVKVGTGTLTLSGNNTYTGGTVVSNGTLNLKNTAGYGSGFGSVMMKSGTTLAGSGAATGLAQIEPGSNVEAIGGVGATPLTLGTLTFGQASTDLTTTRVNVYLGGKIVAASGLTVNGTNLVNILGAAPAVGVYDLITYPGGSIGGAGFGGFVLGSLPYGVVAHLQDSGSAVQLNVTAVTIEPGIWVGNATGTWNLSGTLDWKGATSGNPQPYHDLDVVTFDDSATNFTVNIVTNVTPGGVTVTATHDYTLGGAGGIVGLAALSKAGAGTLILTGPNTFSGGTFITNGVLQLGDGGTNGSLSGAVLNDGLLNFNRADAAALAGVISGTGPVRQIGPGKLTLSGANTYSGQTTVSAGTLAAGNGSALGDTNGITVVANGATLDVGAQNLGLEPITAQGAGVGGAGAIVNNGPGDQNNALRLVTLTGPTTFGGAFRWDIRDPSPASDPNGGLNAFLLGNGNKLTKVSSNIVAFINIGDVGLGDIDIQGGTLTFSRSTVMGNPANQLTVFPGATLQLHRTSEFMNNVLNKVVSMTNATLAVEASGLTNWFAGPITVTGSNTINLPGSTGLHLQGSVGGSGALTVNSSGLLVLSGSCTYSDGTTVNGGVLQVDGSLGTGAHPLVLAGATLTGNGSIADPVTLPSGCTLSPGVGDIGALTLSSSLALSAGSTSRFEVSKDNATNDTVRGLTSVSYGGTLVLTNIGSLGFAPGDGFKLFNASSYSGAFSSIVPATPALGLLWDTNSLIVNGTLKVIVLPTPRPLVVLSVSSLLSNSLNVVFDTEVDSATATAPDNYTISTGQTVAYVTALSTTNYLLVLNTPLTTPTYSVQVKNVKDLAYIPNWVVTTNVPGIAWGFQDSFGIGIADGSAYAFTDLIKIYASGADIFGTSDQFLFLYKEVTGDFDYSVRLQSFLTTQEAAKAGLMIREITDPNFPTGGDRNAMIASFPPEAPGRNQNLFQYREATDASSVALAAPRPTATYPTNWLRLKRTGSVISGFCGNNGLDWTFVGAVDSATNTAGAYGPTVRLGLAVSSHAAGVLTEAVMSNYGLAKERPVLTVTPGAGEIIVSWPAASIGWTLQATPSLDGPSVIWTNVPGSASVDLLHIPVGPGNLYYRMVQ